jgi:hypothetical protein
MSRGKKVERKCKFCGETIHPREADVKRGWGLFCNKTCKASEQERRTGQYRDYLSRGYQPTAKQFSGLEPDCDRDDSWDSHKNY